MTLSHLFMNWATLEAVFKWSMLLIRKQYFYTAMSKIYTRILDVIYLFIIYVKRLSGDYWSDGPFLDLPAIYSAITVYPL